MTEHGTASFIAECYWPDVRNDVVAERVSQVRTTAAAISGRGRSVSLTGSIAVPEDEIVFLLFDADAAESVRLACEEAAIPFDRIVESIDSRPEPAGSRS